jgi:thioredoxin 1
MENVIEVNEDTFQDEVLAADAPVLVDFGAVWCGPCKMLDPIVEELAGEWGSKVKVVHIDVDHSPNTAMQFQVMGVPTLMLFIEGNPVERMTGYLPKKKILSKLEPHIPNI